MKNPPAPERSKLPRRSNRSAESQVLCDPVDRRAKREDRKEVRRTSTEERRKNGWSLEAFLSLSEEEAKKYGGRRRQVPDARVRKEDQRFSTRRLGPANRRCIERLTVGERDERLEKARLEALGLTISESHPGNFPPAVLLPPLAEGETIGGAKPPGHDPRHHAPIYRPPERRTERRSEPDVWFKPIQDWYYGLRRRLNNWWREFRQVLEEAQNEAQRRNDSDKKNGQK